MKKYTKIICMAAAVCLLGAAAFCGFRIYSHYAHESEQEEVFEKIAEVVEQAQTGESETVDVLLTEEETVLAEYGELYLQNTDMVGWLSIAGTNINYPVMQTPNNPNYYLKHNFEKEYSDLGTPYVQENCDLLTSDNLVIYGHHIKGQKMFGALENYKSKDFYEEHKTIRFDTLTKRGEYEIVAVFKTVAYSSAGFRYSRAFTATRDSLIAILPIGYADGFPRNLSCGNSYVLIGGRQAPIVGKICMDQLAVDVTDIPNVKTGSIATLIGKDGKEEITAPMVAESAESITNELLSRMGRRLNIIRRA